MIVSKVAGGLANQIFQWAIAKSLELDGYGKSYLDINFYNNQNGVTKREFSLDKFPFIDYEIFNPLECIEKISSTGIYNDNFIYKNIIPNKNSITYLNGYWQSDKYFIHNESSIRYQLSPDNSTQMKLVDKYPDIIRKSVSLHIRRGDYVHQQQNHPLQSIEYYNYAIHLVGDYDVLYIFSDDINWCIDNLKYDNMVFVNNDYDLEDLWMMNMCNHNIIANSSFSWWGAWLNSNPEKIVISPKNWFGSSLNLSTSDMIPNDWIII